MAMAAPPKNDNKADNREMAVERYNNNTHGKNHVDGGGLSAPQQLLLHLSVRCCFCFIFVTLLLHSV
ncbi:hypothetical protein TSMEX_003357 [Taenia solium]|eukprot:TsM_001219900 transcript=TsM_001219900 gene=TsM_001219900